MKHFSLHDQYVSTRQYALIVISLLLLLALWYGMIIMPLLKKQLDAQQEYLQIQKRVATLQSITQSLSNEPVDDIHSSFEQSIDMQLATIIEDAFSLGLYVEIDTEKEQNNQESSFKKVFHLALVGNFESLYTYLTHLADNSQLIVKNYEIINNNSALSMNIIIEIYSLSEADK